MVKVLLKVFKFKVQICKHYIINTLYEKYFTRLSAPLNEENIIISVTKKKKKTHWYIIFLSVYKNVGSTLHKFPFGRNKKNERKDMDKKVRGSQTE